MQRSLLVLAAAALLARWSVALVTERHPIFPAYAYADAALYDQDARLFAAERRAGRPKPYRLTPNREIYTTWVIFFYYHLGTAPLLLKLINGTLASASVLLWFLLVRSLSPPLAGKGADRAALAAGLLLALWPTHVFYTSQNTKEAWTLLALAAAFYLVLAAGREEPEQPRARVSDLAPLGGALALLLAGLLRDHLVPAAGAVLLAGSAWKAFEGRKDPWSLRRGLWACACVGLAVAVFRPGSAWLFERYHMSFAPRDTVPFVKGYVPPQDGARNVEPWTPEWLTQFRRARQQSDQAYAQASHHRRVGTQLFADLELKTWTDIASFLPAGAFTVLFMPLPGLYPMEGNIGRMLASAENVLILALALLALPGALRWAFNPGRAPLLLFFLCVWLASSLMEVDLGSATRHRIVYLPFILPFSAWQALRLLESRQLRPGRKP
ncbi:MAG: hypothetical protein HY924_03800 [Elusimicrobia bacterium]|nr:hypothetical protein [Elusimicrobiota bacterium]